jgi:hypothetical protein
MSGNGKDSLFSVSPRRRRSLTQCDVDIWGLILIRIWPDVGVLCIGRGSLFPNMQHNISISLGDEISISLGDELVRTALERIGSRRLLQLSSRLCPRASHTRSLWGAVSSLLLMDFRGDRAMHLQSFDDRGNTSRRDAQSGRWFIRSIAIALIWLRRGRGQARETRDPVIERRRIEQADVANAILIFRAKGRLGVGDDSMGSMGNGVRERREGPFLEQIIEPTRHPDRAAVWPQTARRPHTLFQRHRAGIPPWPGD